MTLRPDESNLWALTVGALIGVCFGTAVTLAALAPHL